jgi:hypothetical protein
MKDGDRWHHQFIDLSNMGLIGVMDGPESLSEAPINPWGELRTRESWFPVFHSIQFNVI